MFVLSAAMGPNLQEKKVYAAIDAMCTLYVNTFIFGIISIMMPSLRDPESSIKLTADEESWIASLPFLLVFPAQCVGGFVAERIGRRRIVTCTLLIFAVICVLLSNANGAPALLAAATVVGVAGGGNGFGPILIAESTSPKYRGILLSTKPYSILLGYITAHFLGKFFDWRRLLLVGLAPCALGLVASLSSPESPAWLASRGRFKECARAFQWLRGDEDIAELRALVHAQRDARRDTSLHSNRGSLHKIAQYLTDKCFLQACSISLACMLIIEATVTIIMMYMIDILAVITGDKDNAHYYATALDAQSLVCLFLSTWFIKRFPRRSLLFTTGILAVSFLLVFCLVSYLLGRGVIPLGYVWVKMSPLALFFMMRDVGLCPVNHNILSEVFPLSHRGLGVVFLGLSYSTLAFVFAKILPTMISQFGIHGSFLQLAIVVALSMTYLYFYLPETSNKTLQDIEYEMAGKTMDIKNLKAPEGSGAFLDEHEVCLTMLEQIG